MTNAPAARPVLQRDSRLSPGVRSSAIAAVVYALLVLIMWGAYNPHSGMPYETGFPYMSESLSFVQGFLYAGDWLRIHTNTFYQLSYVLSEVLRIPGSYVPYQVVYAGLWWARGFLVFAIVRRFFPAAAPLCFAAGALTIVHASDGALQWIGQLNQFGFIFWMLLAMYCMTRAWQSGSSLAIAALTLAACFFEHMSLWSYESQLLIVLVFPVFLLLWGKRRKWPLLAAWYVFPALYILLTAAKYVRSAGQTYQESVLRKSWSVGALLGDWAFNIGASLDVWDWTRGGWKVSPIPAYLLSAVAAAVFAAGLLATVRWARGANPNRPFPASVRTCWICAAAGMVVLALSFPVYLLLGSARGLWRTQMLSGPGAGLLMAATLGLIAAAWKNRPARMAVVVVIGAALTAFGSVAAIQKGAFHRWIWERHRATMLEVLQLAPQVRPDTIVVLTNVPKDNDPFGDQFWFDFALRLSYPHVPVSGIYFYPDGTPGPGNNFHLAGNLWRLDGGGFDRLVHTADVEHTLVIEYSPSGKGKLAAAVPAFLCGAQCAQDRYHPDAVVTGREVSPIAARRYRVGD